MQPNDVVTINPTPPTTYAGAMTALQLSRLCAAYGGMTATVEYLDANDGTLFLLAPADSPEVEIRNFPPEAVTP